MSSKPSILLYADSSISADMLYFGDFFVPDPFIAFSFGRRKIAVLSQLEYARGLKESSFDKILSLESYWSQLPTPSIAGVIALIAKDFKIKSFTVPGDFPAKVAFDLQKLGLKIHVADGPLFPKRVSKTDEEAKYIRQGNKASAAGLRAVETILQASKIRSKKLYYKEKALTSEFLKAAAEKACIDQGATSLNTIVAAGKQGCDPHCTGSGIIRANELIIVDIFPRVTKTGYFGDMTRTFLKGRASEAQKRLVNTVRKGQKIALKKTKAGVTGKSIHKAVVDFFKQEGYITENRNGTHVGFFHGTGHGLGLECHEVPRVNAMGPILKKGTVVTIEPGLYYPEIGGVRIEDVVRVAADGYEKLSSYHYNWEIK